MNSIKASGLAVLALCSWGTSVGAAQSAYYDEFATEWSDGQVFALPRLPDSNSYATGINASGQVVGYSVSGDADYATEWSGGQVFALANLPGSGYSEPASINDAGQAVGYTGYYNGPFIATEWSGGQVSALPLVPGSGDSMATGINDDGQVVGYSEGNAGYATEWSGGQVFALPSLRETIYSEASAINDSGEVVGTSYVLPEPSTWAMLLIGFAGLGWAGYRRGPPLRSPTGAC